MMALSDLWRRKSLFDIAQKYDAIKYVDYCATYETLFSKKRRTIKAVLELGIHTGASLLMWRDYFPNALILGVDYNPSPFKQPMDRIRTLQASQDDISAISRFLSENKIREVDFVIDDAAHEGYLAKASFWPLFDNYLKKGGHYIIEDWGTGYWPTFKDGALYKVPDQSREKSEGIFPNHSNGMVGFVKQLVDEAHHTAIVDTHDTRASKFHSLVFREGMAIAHKV